MPTKLSQILQAIPGSEYLGLHDRAFEILEQAVKPLRDQGNFVVSTIPYTPPKLCREIFEKVPPVANCCFSTKICVFYTVEMAIYLTALGFEDMTLATREYDPKMAEYATKFGFSYKLEQEIKNMKFDVVVGNPPYQNDAHAGQNQKNSQMPLWGLFVKLGITIVKENGYLAFVTPNSWLHSGSIAYKAMVSRNLQYVNLTSGKYFTVGTSSCYWITQNNDKYKGTIFQDSISKHTMHLTPGSFVPASISSGFVTALSIIKKTVELPNKLGASISYQHDTSAKKHTLSKIKTKEFCYEIAHTNSANLWSNIQPNNGNLIKVLISLTGSLNKARIDKGCLGTSHVMGYIPVSSLQEANVCLSVIQSKLYKFMIASCRYSSSIPAALFKALPAVDLTHQWTNEELYKHFNLTDEEINLIEETIK